MRTKSRVTHVEHGESREVYSITKVLHVEQNEL